MRIGIDIRLWDESGVGRYIRNLVEQLKILDQENNYTLFVLPKDEESVKYKVLSIKQTNWKIVKANIKWHSVSEQVQFSQILLRENLDLVHFPYHSIPVFYNKPFIVTIHDLIPYNYPTGEASTLPFFIYWLKFLVYKYVLKNAAKKARKIIAVSNATKKEIIKNLDINASKIAVIHEGVSESVRFKKSENEKYFLYVGNAYPHKNLDRLLEAFRAINSKDIHLIFVGKEDYFYKRLKEKVRKMNLEKSVKFLGKISDEELESLYQNAIALAQPSLMEGFGLPALEAMANKCLVLASDIPALKEICQDAAIYFDPYSIDDIAQKLTDVHSNDTYHYSDKIRKGLERSKLFSWEKMARETLGVYESCISL